jgi:spore germination protein YaaH
MKKFLLIIACLIAAAGWFLFTQTRPEETHVSPNSEVTTVPTQFTARPETTSLFVPYWSVNKTLDASSYNQIIYFGITPTTAGINTKDAGFLRLKTFVLQTTGSSTLLTLRMLDNTINSAVLKDPVKQEKIIKETITIAKEHGFDGVVLDLELSALPFESIIQQINGFTKTFAQTAGQENLSFSMAIYGDTFYRIRPFEVKTLAQHADQIMIMAYDMHKANGNPGPNFPLAGKNKYGYDYATLTDNFLAAVPADKLTVIFGLYGYDWQVDEKNISQSVGKPKSLLEVNQLVANCTSLQCQVFRDSLSGETRVTYTDEEQKKHTVWYEDMESVRKKQAYLKSRGITSYSLWAHSYF